VAESFIDQASRVTAFDYWCDHRLTIQVQGPDGTRTVNLEQPFARVGSHRRSDVLLEGEDVPKHGLFLLAVEDGIFCIGLTSGRDGQSQRRWLGADDEVAVGGYRLRVEYAGGDSQAGNLDRAALDEKGTADLPVPVIDVLVNGQRRAVHRCYRQLTIIGRSHPSCLRLKSGLISATHVALVWVRGRCWAIDLLSANGTKKRGQRFDVARLRRGRSLQLGEVALRFASTTNQLWTGSAIEKSASDIASFDLTPPPKGGVERSEEPAKASDSDSPSRRESDTGIDRLSGEQSDEENSGLSDGNVDSASLRKDTADTKDRRALEQMQQQLERKRRAWEEERDRHEQELDDRLSQVDKHFTEIDSWRSELDHRSESLQKESTRVEADREVLSNQQQEIDDSRSELERQRTAFQEEQLRAATELAAERAEWEAERSEWQAEQAALLEARRASDQHTDEQSDQMAASAEALAVTRDELDAQQEELESRRADLDAQRTEFVQQKTEWTEARQLAEDELEQQRADAEQTLARVEQQRLEVEQLQETLHASQAELEEAQTAFEQTKKQLAEDRSALDQQRADQQRVATGEEAKLEDKRRTLASQQEQLEAARIELEKARHELAEQSERSDQQSKQLAADLQSLEERQSECERREQALSIRETEAQQEIEVERNLWKEEQALADAKIEDRKAELEEAKTQLDNERAQLLVDRRQLDAERSRLDQVATEAAERWAEMESLRGRFRPDHENDSPRRNGLEEDPSAENPASHEFVGPDESKPESVPEHFEPMSGDGTEDALDEAGTEPTWDIVTDEDRTGDPPRDEMIDRLVKFNRQKKKGRFFFWR